MEVSSRHLARVAGKRLLEEQALLRCVDTVLHEIAWGI
jgi:hypothetical protein